MCFSVTRCPAASCPERTPGELPTSHHLGVTDPARSALTARRTVTAARIPRWPGAHSAAAAKVTTGHRLPQALADLPAHIPTEPPRKVVDTFPCPLDVTCCPAARVCCQGGRPPAPRHGSTARRRDPVTH